MLSKEHEMELWSRWDSNKTPENLGEIIDALEPTMNHYVNQYANKTNVSRDVLDAEAKIQAMHAIKRYQPGTGTRLTTFVTSYMPKIQRTMLENTNIGYIPEARAIKVNTFLDVQNALQQNLGRVPSTSELSDQLNWSAREVVTMQKELRPAMFEEFSSDAYETNKSRDLIDYLITELSPEQASVYEYMIGYKGKPIMPLNQIAETLGMPTQRVYYLKKQIGEIALKKLGKEV